MLKTFFKPFTLRTRWKGLDGLATLFLIVSILLLSLTAFVNIQFQHELKSDLYLTVPLRGKEIRDVEYRRRRSDSIEHIAGYKFNFDVADLPVAVQKPGIFTIQAEVGKKEFDKTSIGDSVEVVVFGEYLTCYTVYSEKERIALNTILYSLLGLFCLLFWISRSFEFYFKTQTKIVTPAKSTILQTPTKHSSELLTNQSRSEENLKHKKFTEVNEYIRISPDGNWRIEIDWESCREGYIACPVVYDNKLGVIIFSLANCGFELGGETYDNGILTLSLSAYPRGDKYVVTLNLKEKVGTAGKKDRGSTLSGPFNQLASDLVKLKNSYG